jgi:hypothetical protein
MRYRLITREGRPGFVPIKAGRRYVGSVRPAESGSGWVGRIGAHAVTGATVEMAFREVAARAMGFANLASLRASNARARAQNNAARAQHRAAMRHAVGAANLGARRLMQPAPRQDVQPIDDEPFSEA